MKDTETVTLDELRQKIKFGILVPLVSGQEIKRQREAGSLVKKSSHEAYDHAVDSIVDEFIKLFEQAVESAKPEKLNDELNYSAYGEGHDAGISEYEQNLLQALSNSRVQHINRGAGFTHSDSNDCACFSLDAKEDLL